MSTALTFGTPEVEPVPSGVRLTKTVITLPTSYTDATNLVRPVDLGFASKIIYVFPVSKSGYTVDVDPDSGQLTFYRVAASNVTGPVAGPLVKVADAVDLSTTPGTITLFAMGY